MRLPEQNDRHERSSLKKWNKRQTNRAIRREAKRDPENAPRKARFYGYTS